MPSPNEGWGAWGLIQLSLGTQQAWNSLRILLQDAPTEPFPRLRKVGLVPSGAAPIPSPSLWWHDTSPHNLSMGYNQHSLGRETAVTGNQQGWDRESVGQQPRQEKHGRQHQWLRSRWQSLVSISRPEPLVFGFRLFAVSGLSLLTEPWLVNNPWRGTVFSSPRHCLGPSLESKIPPAASRAKRRSNLCNSISPPSQTTVVHTQDSSYSAQGSA